MGDTGPGSSSRALNMTKRKDLSDFHAQLTTLWLSGMPMEDIAAELSCGTERVRTHVRRLGLPERAISPRAKTLTRIGDGVDGRVDDRAIRMPELPDDRPLTAKLCGDPSPAYRAAIAMLEGARR
jgi:DNA-binding CsgD family transcriptional regulator